VKRSFLFGFVALVCFDTMGQLGFKFAGEAVGPMALASSWLAALVCSPYFYLTLLAYLGAFFVYMHMLEHAPIGPLFAASHMELVTITLISVGLLGERFSALQALGCVLIVAGVALLGVGETRAARR
jgi:drug/metabolite transporter (DMT)-like permease